MALAKPKITIIGSGMGGTFLAILLANKGFSIEIFEQRPDLRKIPPNADRSINQSLSIRGIKILEEVGLWKALQKMTLKELGRTVHNPDGSKFFSPYGRNKNEIQYSFNRNSFNSALLNRLDIYKKVKIYFATSCQNVNFQNRTLELRNEKTGLVFEKKFSILVGADGINSIVRKKIDEVLGENAEKRTLNWGYKNFYLPSSKKLASFLRNDTFHIWPREESTLFAIPNVNGSFNSTLILPLETNGQLVGLQTATRVKKFFTDNYHDVLPFVPHLLSDFKNNKTGRFTSIYTDNWYYQDLAVLLGDSAHAIMPFYSQGVSATFEDCLSLANNIEKYYPNWKKTFKHYQQERKENTDTLANLSELRFRELKDGFRSWAYVVGEKIELTLTKIFPFWRPLYTLIAHTSIPYREALKKYQKQLEIRNLLFAIVFLLILILVLLK